MEAVSMARGRGREDLDTDRQFSLALLKLIEIVGEAASRVSADMRDQYPDIPWPQVIATRHRLVHGYDQVNHRVLWDIVAADLPPLIERLHAILMERDKA